MLIKPFSWDYGRCNASPGSPPLSFMTLCFTTYSDIFIWGFLWILKYHVSMFKLVLYIHGTMLLHAPLMCLEKHPTLSQEKAHHPTVISSTTVSPRYFMKGNKQMWSTRTAHPTDPRCSCCICKCPGIQERQVLQGEVISFMKEVNMK